MKKKKRNIHLFIVVFVAILLCSGVLVLFHLVSLNYSRMYSYLPNLPQSTKNSNTMNTSFNQIYGVNVDMSQLLPTSTKYVKNNQGEDLIDIAARLGVNTLRITNATPSYEGSKGIYSNEEWKLVLDKMKQNNMKALILIENPTIQGKYISDAYLPFVKKYLLETTVLSHPSVYAVDLYNEAVINNQDNLEKLTTAAHMIRSLYPQMRITVGWWAVDTFKKDTDGNAHYKWDDYQAGRALESLIDFYSLHMYSFDLPVLGVYPDPYRYTKGFLSDVKNALQTTKPILIEEFGAANGEAVSDQDSIGSEELQANSYFGVYSALHDLQDSQILGSIAYQFNTRLDGPDAWAITKNNGNELLPAAYVLQRFAKGLSEKNIPVPYPKFSNGFLFTADDDKSIKMVKLQDNVGLKVQLDPAFSYTLLVSQSDVLVSKQQLTNYWGQKDYFATFQAKKIGRTTLSIMQNNTNKMVYKLTIVVNE